MMRELFTRNVGLKLLALTLAISIELYFISPRNLLTQTLKVPVHIRNLPPKRIVVSPLGIRDGYSVDVQVRGPSPLLQQLQSSAYRFHVDVPPSALENFSYRFDPQALALPPGVEVTDINPPKIDFELEPLVSKSLAVNCEFVGELPHGYILESKQIIPSTLIAHGPMSALRGMREIVVHKVDLSKISETTELELPVHDIGPLITLDVNVVTVQLNVQPKIEQRTFPKVRVRIQGQASGATALETPSVKVILNGPAQKLAEVMDEELEAVADITGLTEGRQQVRVVVNQPRGLAAERVIPETASVVVGRAHE